VKSCSDSEERIGKRCLQKCKTGRSRSKSTNRCKKN
jgi:hypothetical protein